MTNQFDAMLTAIRQSPRDDQLRLMYADELERSGETERADFIRSELGVEVSRGAGPRAVDQASRQARSRAIAGPVAAHARSWEFDRGLVTRITADFATMTEHGEALLGSAPITALELVDDENADWDAEEAAVELAACPWLTHLKSLTIGAYCVLCEARPVELLLQSPPLSALESLCLGLPMSAAKAAGWRLPKLRDLIIRCEGANGGDEALDAIAQASSPLKTLELSGCGVSARGLGSLASAPFALEHLSLGGTHYLPDEYGAEGMRLLAAAPVVSGLRHLVLQDGGLDDTAIEALALSPMRALNHVGLASNAQLSDAGVKALGNSAVLEKVETLDLSGTAVTEAGAVMLRRSRFGRALRVVRVGPEGETEAGG